MEIHEADLFDMILCGRNIEYKIESTNAYRVYCGDDKCSGFVKKSLLLPFFMVMLRKSVMVQCAILNCFRDV